jgi:hypothetical protein
MAALCWRRFSDCRALFAADLIFAKAADLNRESPGGGPVKAAYSLGLADPCQ